MSQAQNNQKTVLAKHVSNSESAFHEIILIYLYQLVVPKQREIEQLTIADQT